MGSESVVDFYALWTTISILICSKMITAKDHSEYYTAYACDGKMLRIECKEGYIINLIRANYGRYSIAVCNDNGSTDWSVNCMSHRSFSILQQRCSQKRNCSVPASTSLFDDPCPGTIKYLEAHYACVSATAASTQRTTPPWLMTSPPSVWIAAKAFTMPPEVVATPSSVSSAATTIATSSTKASVDDSNDWLVATNTVPSIADSSPSPADSDFAIAHVTLPDGNSLSSTDNYAAVPFDEQKPLCKPTVVRNLSWNWTYGGDISIQPCPGGATGLARWRCQQISDAVTIWFPDTPDLSQCRSVWVNNLESRISKEDSLPRIAADLCQVTESKMLFGGDMITTVKIIKDLANKMSKDIQTFPDHNQREAMVNELLRSATTVSSNLLDLSQRPSWNDLSHKEQMQVVTHLLIGLEDNSFLMAETVIKETVVNHCTKNILLSVQVLETRNVVDEVFPTYSVVENCPMRINNWLQLPKQSLLENSEGGLVRLVYTSFDTLEHILKIPPTTGKEEKRINSKILSASLGKGTHIQLTQPVVLCLQHIQTENVSNPTCVFWDYLQNTWSEEGCTLWKTNETHTICKCNHLTNFAILVDVTPTSYVNQSMSRPMFILLVCVILIALIAIVVVALRYVRKHNTPKEYGTTFSSHDRKWLNRCFGCCLSSSKSEKTVNCKEPRPAPLYGNPTMQAMASVDVEGTTIRPIHHLTHPSTIPRSYLNENGCESHYPTPSGATLVKLNHHYPTYNRGNSMRKIKEARRLAHLENTLQHCNKLAGASGCTLRLNSPRSSHTYSEISGSVGGGGGSGRNDPIYEEIERERVEHCRDVSDVSDEDAKRASDMSRQSSKSYSDHRPLIPYNAVADRSFHAALDAAYRQQLKEHSARTVSVLDGQTVICHLQHSEPKIYHKTAVSHPPHHF